MIRYAEILLGYAETLNELGDSKNAVKTVNLIRKRAGVGELDENKNWNKDELRQRIYKEYRVEFAFEDNRFFDARRWAKAEEWFSKPVYKVTVTGSLENPTYTRSLLEESYFLSISWKNVFFFPNVTISQSRSKKLTTVRILNKTPGGNQIYKPIILQ